MQEIKCPNCGQVFVVDDSGYAQIVQQVRDKEFEKELGKREAQLEEVKETEIKLACSEQKEKFDSTIASKEAELLKKDADIERLKQQIAGSETEKKLAVSEISQNKEKELSEKETEIINLKNQLANQKNERELQVKSINEKHAEELKRKDEEIEYYKDFKGRQSTKMIGESLEQHCLTQFNSLRMTAFPNAYFEKDNDISSGSKGDFIYRESVDDVEFISIMFDMKNEMDETNTKHKNEDFFKKLDKDRRNKKCEYAVLVSLLEPDSELYNNGIVDVSYRYEKMYVIRPQFFIPIITLLRNAALNSLQYRQEAALARSQQLDVTHFEENMNTFKAGFARNYELASKKFNTAIEEIDKSIEHLQKIKDALLSSKNNLRLANDKANDLSIKKLTKNAPSVRKMFEDAEN